MRNKLCILALTGLLSLAGGVAFAQDNAAPQAPEGRGYGHRGMMNPDEQLKHLTKQLDLTSDQQAQIKPLLESQQQQAMQLHQDQSLSPTDRRTKMMAIHNDTKSKIEAVLNDSQKQKYAEMQEKMQERMQERMQGGQTPQAQPQ